MSITLRGGVWHCHFVTPSGKRIRRSLGTGDKKQAQELHDKFAVPTTVVERTFTCVLGIVWRAHHYAPLQYLSLRYTPLLISYS